MNDKELSAGAVAEVRIVPALLKDAQIITSLRRATFDDDAARFAPPKTSPPRGYDSVEHTEREINLGSQFKVLVHDELIGALEIHINLQQEHLLSSFFLVSQWQSRGIGTKIMQTLEEIFPSAVLWRLSTAEWATRNHYFYEKLGYVRVGEYKIFTGEYLMYLYEKRMRTQGDVPYEARSRL